MPLSKYPIEVPLGGAVDEGNVPEIVQPPRIREATDCASIKGGAYTKKDAQEILHGPGDPVPSDALEIERDGDATVIVRPTAVRRLRDGGGQSDSYPSPVTGRSLRGFYPTEADGVKETGDHATLELPNGRTRTLAAWDVAPAGNYVAVNSDNALGTLPQSPTPNDSIWANSTNHSQTYRRGSGARFATFEGDVQEGQERAYPSLSQDEIDALTVDPVSGDNDRPWWNEGAVVGYPRVRADQVDRLFWSVCAIAINQSFTSNQPGDVFWLSTRPAATSDNLNQGRSDSRDILSQDPSPANDLNTVVNVVGCKIFVHNEEGEVLATAVTEAGSAPAVGDALLPPLEIVVVEGEGVYTLHPEPQVPGPGAPNALCTVRKWQYLSGPNQIVPDPVSPSITIDGGSPYTWPAGLHDMGSNQLLVMWSDSRRDILDYALAPLFVGPAIQIVGGCLSLDPVTDNQVMRYTLSGQTGSFARISEGNTVDPPTPSDPTLVNRTAQMTRGIWPGSFLAPTTEGPVTEDTLYWVGVQMVSQDAGFSGVPGESSEGPLGGFAFGIPPRGYSGSVAHALIDREGTYVVNGLNAESASVIPGCVIATQGAYVEGIGPSVGFYVSAPGDTRTLSAARMPPALADVPSVSFVLTTRREIEDLVDFPVEEPMAPTGTNASNQAVAYTQLLPLGQCINTYTTNPYQVRTNLDVRPDGTVRLVCFERRAIGTFRTDDYRGAFLPQDRPAGDCTQASPYIASIDPVPVPQTATARGYVCVDGAQPVSVGGPQGLTAGYGVQPIFECESAEPGPYRPVTSGADWTYRGSLSTPPPGAIPGDAGTFVIPDPPGGTFGPFNNQTPGSPYNLASHLVTEDEDGGEHRSVPFSMVGSQLYSLSLNPPSDWYPYILEASIYPFPYAMFGLPNSQRAYVEFYCSGSDGAPTRQEVGRFRVPLTGNYFWAAGPTPGGGTFTRMAADGGSGKGLYTDAGELAADAPDPSACVASARSRVWSVSLTRPRVAQYTKLLRSGYAPEWNGNLSVRVPDATANLTAVAVLPDGRVLLFSPTSIHYTYGEGPSDTGQGAGFAEPAMLTDTLGCANKRAMVTGDFGCIFQGDRGFYRVDRQLAVSYIGLPYEDTTVGGVYAASVDGYRSEAIFYSADSAGGQQQRWVYNYLRDQWSTFENTSVAIGACERDARPLTLITGSDEIQAVTRDPASIEAVGLQDTGAMSLATGWLAMGKIQGFGRTWEVQLTGTRDAGSLSGLRVEVLYDYLDTPAETYDFDAVGAGQFKVRFRPRRQKSEAISFRFSEYVPVTNPPTDPDQCTGWRLDMCTVLAGVKAGLDKVPVTVRSS